MANRSLYVKNLSDHRLKIVNFSGDNFVNLTKGEIIGKNQETPQKIGDITEPKIFNPFEKDFGKGHWGCIYLEDMVNFSQIELFAYVDPRIKSRDHSGTGWRSWNSKIDQNKGIRIPDPYLKASHDGDSFTFTIEQIPTDSYMFNMGRYQCGFGPIDEADHVFVIVRDYYGKKEFFFDCYGGHGDNSDEKQSLDPCRVSCRGGSHSLRLAKAICCLDPNDSRNEFKNHTGGRLFKGDCSAILFGVTGVCHQMANRICAAGIGEPTKIDALDFADVRMGNATRNLYGPWGTDIPINKKDIDYIKEVFSTFASYVPSQGEIESLLNTYKKHFVPLEWIKYFQYCYELSLTK